MIASLNGTVLSKKPDRIVVDVNGVGYSVAIPLRDLGEIPDEDSSVFLHIYTHVREDAIQLFGFTTEDGRRLFSTLLGITGVGPKLALAILSGMPAERFTDAVYNEDVALLSTIPGLGKKTASRLILELKGKLRSFGGAFASAEGTITNDAVSALENLGYKRAVSEKAVASACSSGASAIEDIIREALKSLTEK